MSGVDVSGAKFILIENLTGSSIATVFFKNRSWVLKINKRRNNNCEDRRND